MGHSGPSRRDVLHGGAVAALSALSGTSKAETDRGPGLRVGAATTAPGIVALAASVLETTDGYRRLEVAAHLSGPGSARIAYWPVGSPQDVSHTAYVPTNAADVVKVRIATSQPGHAYRAEVLGGGTSQVQATPEWLPRGKAGRFSFVFGSCTLIRGTPVLDAVAAGRPRFFAMIGDAGYVNSVVPQDYALYAATARLFLQQETVAALAAKTPIMAIADDHDNGRDDCSGLEGTANGIVGFAAQAFADSYPGALYPANTYRSWTIGHALFLLLENRRYAADGSRLGLAQKAWLLNTLASTTARVVFVLCPMTPSWYWSAHERAEVVHAAAETGRLVIFLSGDKHRGAMVQMDASRRVYELLCGPLQNTVYHQLPDLAAPMSLLWSFEEQERTTPPGSPPDLVGRVKVRRTEVVLQALTAGGKVVRSFTLPI